MAYTISLHTYKDAELISAIQEAESFGFSKGKATKTIMRLGISAWVQLTEEAKKAELSK